MLSSAALLEQRSCRQRLSSSHLSYMSGAVPCVPTVWPHIRNYTNAASAITDDTSTCSQSRRQERLSTMLNLVASFFHHAEAGEPLWFVFKHFLQLDTAVKTVLDVKTWTWCRHNFSLCRFFLIRASAMTHRCAIKVDMISKSKDIQAGLYYLGRCELCRLVMTSLRFLECLDGWKASVCCSGLYISVSACCVSVKHKNQSKPGQP